MALNFDKYAQDANGFIKHLAEHLGHPGETSTTGRILRAILHTLRDRLTISESLDLLSQLPMFLKAVYVENWKYREKPTGINTIETFTGAVEKHQDEYGENDFAWSKSTREIIHITLHELSVYISPGESNHIVAQLPEDLKEMFREGLE